jgi:hypothetical protein
VKDTGAAERNFIMETSSWLIWYKIDLPQDSLYKLMEEAGNESDQKILGPDPHQYLFADQDCSDDH